MISEKPMIDLEKPQGYDVVLMVIIYIGGLP